jgi:hypothetical protein
MVKRYIAEAGTNLVLHAMDEDDDWVGSALLRTESRIALCRQPLARSVQESIAARLADDWARFFVVDVDSDCLEVASQIGCTHGLRSLDAIHLAAGDRLPRPCSFLTFDARQRAAARVLGLDIVPIDA